MKTDGAWLPILQSPIAAVFLACSAIAIGFTIYGEIKKMRNK